MWRLAFPALSAAYPAYQELYFQQKVDHFDASSDLQWAHRYLLNNESWDGRGELENGCRGPILVYTGNEGAIEAFWNINGWMIEELAPRFGAMLLFPEQRFYGKSLPFGRAPSADEMRTDATGQVVEDYATLLREVRATLPGAAGCPAVAFGGSYGATLAALLRAKHPDVVVGAHAASSELGYYDFDRWAEFGVDEYSWEDVVISSWDAHPGCLDAVHAVSRTIAAQDPRGGGWEERFHVCDIDALGMPRSDMFAYAVESLTQENYPYAIGDTEGNPVEYHCAKLVGAVATADTDTILDAAAVFTDWYLGGSESQCIPKSVGGVGNTPGDGPGSGPWGYQSCTETLHANSARSIRKFNFDLAASARLCDELWNRTVKPNLTALAGGFALADGSSGVNNLIWTQGTIDPWGGWFVGHVREPPQGSGVHHFVMRGAAHHLDLKGSNEADPVDVTRTRRAAEKIIMSWIHEASSALVV